MRRRALFWMSVGVLAGCVSRPRMPDLRQAVAPTGTLRAGVSAAPNVSLSFAARGPAGEFSGPPVDILRSFAQHLAVDLELIVKQGSGQLAEALSKGELDIAFLPPDAERRGIADFGPDIFAYESTYLARGDLGLRSVQDIDRAGLRIVGIANTVTVRVANGSLKNVRLDEVRSVDEAIERLRSNSADAFALGRQPLVELLPTLPGFVILDGAFQRGTVALAIPKGRTGALLAVRKFSEYAKTSGLARQILIANGLPPGGVAGSEPR